MKAVLIPAVSLLKSQTTITKLSTRMIVHAMLLEGPIECNAAGQSALSLYNTESASKVLYSAFPQFQAKDRIYAFLSRALEYRTTRKLEDEAVYLASILGVNDLKSVVNGSTAEQRMQALYTLIGQLPASVLFHRSK